MPNIKDKITGLFGAKKEPQKTAAELEVERRIAEKKFQKKMEQSKQKTQDLAAKAAKAEKSGNHALALQYAKLAMTSKKANDIAESSVAITGAIKDVNETMKGVTDVLKNNPVEKIDTGMVSELVKQQTALQVATEEQTTMLDVLFEAIGIDEEAEFVGTGDPKAEEFLAKIMSDEQVKIDNTEILNDSISQLEEQLKKHS